MLAVDKGTACKPLFVKGNEVEHLMQICTLNFHIELFTYPVQDCFPWRCQNLGYLRWQRHCMISLPDGVKRQPDQLLVPEGITTTITMSTDLHYQTSQMLSNMTRTSQVLGFVYTIQVGAYCLYTSATR